MDNKKMIRMPTALKTLVFLVTLLFPLWSLAAPVALESISHQKLPGDHLRVKLGFSGEAPDPLSFTIANPARIALDFPNTRNELKHRTYPINIGATRSVVSAQARDRTRIVVNLNTMVRYTASKDGNNVYLDISPSMAGGSTQNQAPIPQPVKSATTVTESPVSSSPVGRRQVSNIDFRRGQDGAGRVLIYLTDPNTPVDIKQQGSNIIVDLQNIDVPPHLQRRLDVLDFATPVQSLDTRQSGSNVQVIIKSQGNVSQLAYQSNGVYTVEVKPYKPSAKRERRKKEVTYTGEKLSLNFQDIEVRSVLQLIADFTGLNVVVSDSVNGNLTLRLKNVPWDQALDIIMLTKGLDKRQEGNVLLIAPAEEIAKRERDALSSSQEVQALSPLRTEIIALNYADASEVADLLRAQGTARGQSGSKSNSIISKRGSVSVDRRTNNLLVHETTKKIDEIRALVQSLDIPVRQVMIESRIVTASDNFTRELGVSFAASNRDVSATQQVDTNFNVSLPVTSPAGSLGLSLAKIPLGAKLDLELSAAQEENRVEIVASPRIITANKTQARIEQGVEIPYEEATSSGATSVSFKKAVMSLEVTPHITKDDRINMELQVTRDSQGGEVSGVPTINTRKVKTQVLVNNGQTVVLGGIFEKTQGKVTTKVPLLGDLPVLGHLFRTDKKELKKSELLIFVTPKIINENLNLR
ncbi:MAG: type IV pilus secretin PilQ [bacterium]